MGESPDTIRVIYVDGDAELADSAVRFLERRDERLRIETATTATEGLNRLVDEQFHCVVSAYDLPDRDGITFLEEVRQTYPDLPFILYTASGSERVASNAISAGVTDYIEKERGTGQYAVLATRITTAVESYWSRRALTRRYKDLRQYEQMVNTMQEAACIYDPDGRFVLVNEYLAEWYGTTREALEGEPSNLIPTIREQSRIDEHYQALLDGRREQLTGEVEAEFPNHGHAVLEYRLVPMDTNGAIEGVVGVTREITEREKRERELRRIELRYQAVFNDPNILVKLLDTDGTVLDANETALGYVDATREDVTDRPLWETPWFEYSEALQSAVEGWVDRAVNGEYVELSADLVRPDGDPYTVEGVFRPVTNDDCEVVSVLVSARDVTERKEHEQELERMRELFREAERLGELGAWELNASGEVVWTDGTRRIHEVGDDYEPTLGGAIGFYHPDDREEVERAVEDAIETGNSYDVIARLTTANGNKRWVHTRGTPLGDGSTLRGYIQDITDRKEQLRQIEMIDTVLRHNLYNDMTVILGHAAEIREVGSEDAVWSAERIHETGEELIETINKERLVTDFLASQPSTASVDAATFVRTAVEELRDRYPDADISVTVPDEQAVLAVEQIRKAIIELIENAITFSDRDVPSVTVGLDTDGEMVAIRIADDGPGIPDMERHVLVEGEDIQPLYHGSGFGLWLVNVLVHHSGGTLAVTENDPRGTIVTMRLPAS